MDQKQQYENDVADVAEIICRAHTESVEEVSSCAKIIASAMPMGKAFDVSSAFCTEQCSNTTAPLECTALCTSFVFNTVVGPKVTQ